MPGYRFYPYQRDNRIAGARRAANSSRLWRPRRATMAVLCAHLVRPVLLPNDTQRGSVDTKADVVGLTIYGHVADRHSCEAVTMTVLFLGRHGLVVLVKCNNNRSAVGSGLAVPIGQNTIEPLLLSGTAGTPCHYGEQCADNNRGRRAGISHSHFCSQLGHASSLASGYFRGPRYFRDRAQRA